MKINKSELLKALNIVKPGLASKDMLEQTTSFAFLNGRVITYNDELSLSCPLKEIEFEGAIQAAELYAFVSKIKKEEIDLEKKENEIILLKL